MTAIVVWNAMMRTLIARLLLFSPNAILLALICPCGQPDVEIARIDTQSKLKTFKPGFNYRLILSFQILSVNFTTFIFSGISRWEKIQRM